MLYYFQNAPASMDGYKLEITTTFFVIDTKTGVLLVNEANLDRDPPSSDRLTFQVCLLG